MSFFRSSAGFFPSVLAYVNLEISFAHAGRMSRATWLLLNEKAAYLALNIRSNPFDSERTQRMCVRHSFEQYRLPAFIKVFPQARHGLLFFDTVGDMINPSLDMFSSNIEIKNRESRNNEQLKATIIGQIPGRLPGQLPEQLPEQLPGRLPEDIP